MRRFIYLLLLSVFFPTYALGHGYIHCVTTPTGLKCFTAQNFTLPYAAQDAAFNACKANYSDSFCQNSQIVSRGFENLCAVVVSNSQAQPSFAINEKAANAFGDALAHCIGSERGGFSCQRIATVCDGSGVPLPPTLTSTPSTQSATSTPSNQTSSPQIVHQIVYLSNDGLAAAVGGFCAAILLGIALLFRQPIANFVIHGNLPRSLPVYGDDIQVIFKRTQRINWYGRVIFGIAVKFAMAEQQLSDTRKYWLGRVIAFDSLRRQRQNELARMHLQLAAAAKPESNEKTALRQLWAAIKYTLFVLFYLARAMFSFLFGFLFIRVTIAKLVRGTKVESRNLILVLQAKTAIEETAHYLKEYLTTANSFDGSDEVHDA